MDEEELLNSVDIVGFIGQFTELEQRSANEWCGLSCFNKEKTPSLFVRADPPAFYDFSSGENGGILTFVRHYFHCSRADAIEIIKKYTGFTGVFVPKLSATASCKKFQRKENKKPREDENKSIVLPNDYMERFVYDEDKLKVWIDEGITPAVLQKFQVRYDPSSNRIVYPIRDPEGHIVNIGGRTLDPEWKEKRLKKYCYYFNWGQMKSIYGFSENLEAIKSKHEIILFEGAKSVMKMASWDIENCGAILTSHLNPVQMKLLAKLGCNVVFALDKEVNIKADSNISTLKHYVNVSFLSDRQGLLGEKDAPVDKGLEVFQQLYERRLPYR